jgi:hypothetical protein
MIWMNISVERRQDAVYRNARIDSRIKNGRRLNLKAKEMTRRLSWLNTLDKRRNTGIRICKYFLELIKSGNQDMQVFFGAHQVWEPGYASIFWSSSSLGTLSSRSQKPSVLRPGSMCKLLASILYR